MSMPMRVVMSVGVLMPVVMAVTAAGLVAVTMIVVMIAGGEGLVNVVAMSALVVMAVVMTVTAAGLGAVVVVMMPAAVALTGGLPPGRAPLGEPARLLADVARKVVFSAGAEKRSGACHVFLRISRG